MVSLFQLGGLTVLRRHLPILTLSALLTAATVHDTWALCRYPFAAGVNGYYYVLQVDSLRDRGQAYFSKLTPAMLYLFAGISHLTGNSILAVKLGAILLHILLCLGVYLLISESTLSKWLGVAGCLLAAVSGLRLYPITEFTSNLGAIMLLVWCAWCSVKFINQRKKTWAFGSLLLLGTAILSHRSAAAIAALFGVLIFVQSWLFGGRPDKSRPIIGLIVTFALWITPTVLAVQKVIQLPALLAKEFSISPKLPFDQFAFPEEIILFLSAIGSLALLVQQRRRFAAGPAALVFSVTALFALVVTLNPFLSSDRGWLGIAARLRVFSYVQVAILVPGIVWLLLRSSQEKFTLHVAAFVVPMMIVSVSLPLPRGMQADYLERRSRLIRSLETIRPRLASSPLIIAPHGDQFLITAITGIPSQQRPPETSQYEKVYWLLNDVNDPVLSADSFKLFNNDYPATVLVEDAVLKSRWEAMTRFERSRLLATNSYLAKFLINRDPVSD